MAKHKPAAGSDGWESPLLDSERQLGLLFAPAVGATHGGVGLGGLPRLAIVAGWWLSEDRHVKKCVAWARFTSSVWFLMRQCAIRRYAEVYQRLGWPVLRINGTTSPTVRESVCAKTTAAMLQCVGRLTAQGGSVVFHSFSNGGCLLYASFVDQLMNTRRTSPSRVDFVLRGAVFDSCPGTLELSVLASSLEASTRRRSVLWAMRLLGFCGGALAPVALALVWRRLPRSFKIIVAVWVVWAVVRAATGGHVLPWSLRQQRYWDSIRRAGPTLGLDELFLYSTSDKLVPASMLDALVGERKQMRAAMLASRKKVPGSLQVKRWTDSPHVGHFRRHPEEYVAAVTTLIHQVEARERSEFRL